jgi:Holliday junction resolvase RusA-like endonuclease
MCQKVFKIISPVVPTFNRNEKQKRKDQRKLYRYLKHQHGIVKGIKGNLKFYKPHKLWAIIFYFNHDTITSAKDIHNIIKPLFDDLEDYVYDDDKQIIIFEGTRLDMEDVDEAFVIEFLDYDMPDIQKILQETCCLVEIGILPFIEESTVLKITWL